MSRRSKPNRKPGTSENPRFPTMKLSNYDIIRGFKSYRKRLEKENLRLMTKEKFLYDNSGSPLLNAIVENQLIDVNTSEFFNSALRSGTDQNPSNVSGMYNDITRLAHGFIQLEEEELRLMKKDEILNGNTPSKIINEIIKHILSKANRSEEQDDLYSESFLMACLKLAIIVPEVYDKMAKELNIPLLTIIKQHVSIVSLRPGINNPIFHNLKLILSGRKYKRVENILLLFGEISYTVCESSNGDKSTDNLDSVDTVLCFMIHGIFHVFSQPVAFYFLNKTADCDIRKKCIVEVITALQQIGFKVRATVSDQVKNNMLAVEALVNEANSSRISNNENEKESYLVNNIEIVHIYDPPHLLIGIRNNLIKANLHLTNMTGKWEHIVQAYKYNKTMDPWNMMPNVTENHLNPSPKEKMNLKMCTDIFSCQPGWLINIISNTFTEMKGTGFVMLYFSNLFDSVNAPVKKKKKWIQHSRVINKNKLYWSSCINELQEAYFEHVSPTGSSQDRPSSLKGWVVTLKSLIHLYEQLTAEYGREHKIFTGNLNLNSLKRFFSAVQSYDKQNKNRTRENFISYFTQILYDNLTSPKNFCCDCNMKQKCAFWSENDPLFQMIPKNEPSETMEQI